MQPLSGGVQLMHIGSGADHGVDQARGRIHSDMATHPEKPLVPLGHRVHLWIALPLFVLGRTGSVDDRGIEDRPLLQQGALILERLLDPSKIWSPIPCSSSR